MFAHWDFACVTEEGVAPKLLLGFRVVSLDGEPVHHSYLILSLRQTAPASIIGIQGPASLTPLREPETRVNDGGAHDLLSEPMETTKGIKLQRPCEKKAIQDEVEMHLARQNHCGWLHGFVNGVYIFDRCDLVLFNILAGLLGLISVFVWRRLRRHRRQDKSDDRGIWRDVERQSQCQGRTRHIMQHHVDEKTVCEKEVQCTDPAQQMADEISSFRMAAELVQDMVDAERARS